ncbi:unnamed protein product [Adineta steineri]|uniref:Uncharacterized protein n=1 Tax=Adineta steineri TaxID=433720 RepID=A0A818RCP4_9BILA|nr:unnamed protein product [Adineta steineri]CAF3655065.1 unnamed protein product [Adineta steineri]
MRKIYWRRNSLTPIIFLVLLICFITFITTFHINQESIISFIYHTPNNCDELARNSLLHQSTIPPYHLLIPYQEFAMRTSISCHSYKLDEPKKNPSKLHPRHSQYLRGKFPYIVPYSNITFNDIENFYTKILITKKNQSKILQTSFASNISFENIPYIYKNGMWHPVGVISAQRTAILIPLQGRDFNAKTFIFNIHAFARRQLLTYTILLIEQVHPLGHRFNKGRLFNAGVRYIQNQESLNITCLILHDVDLIPENDGNFYTCEPIHPKHTTIRVQQVGSKRGYTRYYEFLIGGVLLLTMDLYKKVNGFSNLYWGWGGEDDDLSLRFIQRRICVVRPSDGLAIYAALPHPRGQRNNARFNLLTWSTVRLDTDGFAQIDPMIRFVEIRKRSTVTHIKLDVNANEDLYKAPSMEEYQSLTDQTDEHITTTRKTIITKKNPDPLNFWNRQSLGIIQCSNCHSATSQCWCNNCHNNYCAKGCDDVHAIQAFQNHRIISLREKSVESVTCEKHKDHPYITMDNIAKELETKVYPITYYLGK